MPINCTASTLESHPEAGSGRLIKVRESSIDLSNSELGAVSDPALARWNRHVMAEMQMLLDIATVLLFFVSTVIIVGTFCQCMQGQLQLQRKAV